MFCTNCGAENETGAKFCSSCGRPLEETPAPRTEDTGSDQPASPVSTSAETTTETPEEAAPVQYSSTSGQYSSQSGQYSQNSQNTQNGAAGQDRSMYKSNYNSGDSDATVALILGIVSMVMCSSSLISVALGIGAIVMAKKAQDQGSQSGNISAGRICGIIGICLGSLCTLYYLFAFVLRLFTAFV